MEQLTIVIFTSMHGLQSVTMPCDNRANGKYIYDQILESLTKIPGDHYILMSYYGPYGGPLSEEQVRV